MAVQQIAVDAFGNALGSSIAEMSNSTPMQQTGPLPGQLGSGSYGVGDVDNLLLEQFGRGSTVTGGTAQPLPDVTPADHRASERAYREMTENSAAGVGYRAVQGDSISRILGTSNPQAVGNFMRANGLSSSNIIAGRNYFVPTDTGAYGNSAALGEATLNADNAALAARLQAQGATSSNQLMSQDEAYALYMGSGGRSVSYANTQGAVLPGLPGYGDGFDLMNAESGGGSGQASFASNMQAFNRNLAGAKQDVLQSIADERLGWVVAVAADFTIPNTFAEAALVAAGPVIGPVFGSGVAVLNKLPVLGTDLVVATGRLGDDLVELGGRLLDNASGPRLNPQFGGVLINRRAENGINAASSAGKFGGATYPPEKMRQLVQYLEKRGVSVYGTGGNPSYTARADGTGMMLLPENPTVLQVKHELSHYLDHRNVGFDAYRDMGRVGREQSVLNRLENNRIWTQLNAREQSFSRGYVDDLINGRPVKNDY